MNQNKKVPSNKMYHPSLHDANSYPILGPEAESTVQDTACRNWEFTVMHSALLPDSAMCAVNVTVFRLMIWT